MFQYSERTTARINAALASMKDGFETKSAKKDATDALNRAYEEISNALGDALRDAAGRPWMAENRNPTEAEWSAYIDFTRADGRDLPMYLNQVRGKHTAAVAEFLPAASSALGQLIYLYETVKAAEVKPRETKAAKARKAAMEVLDPATANVVAAAVAPLKADAIKRAEKDANELVAKVAMKLAEAGNDLDVVAPRADWRRDDERTREMKNGKRALFSALTKARESYTRHGEPSLADMDPEGVARFVENAKYDAGVQYDAFTAKLALKCGEGATAAKLEGNHVWGCSTLTVTKPGGTEFWYTQQIVNVSKLGKLFNQWPTRKRA